MGTDNQKSPFPPMYSEDIPQGNERDILITLFTSFKLFAQNQERTNQAHNERLLEVLHKQETKADKVDVSSIQHEISKKADKLDIEQLKNEDKGMTSAIEEIGKRVGKLEERNRVVDSETRGKQKAFDQIRGLGTKAWAFIVGIISFGIMIIEFLKK